MGWSCSGSKVPGRSINDLSGDDRVETETVSSEDKLAGTVTIGPKEETNGTRLLGDTEADESEDAYSCLLRSHTGMVEMRSI